MRKNGRVTAYIHMDVIAENFRRMKENMREETKMVAVIKTDGYGHGAVPIAKMVEGYDYIWGFAVAACSEAMELRDAGIKKPILILGYTFEEDYPIMVEQSIRPTIFTLEMARKFSDAAKELSVCAPFHLAVDTGMSRIGVYDNETGTELAKKICALPNLYIEGVFTHFARADEIDKTAARNQMQRFETFCNQLEQNEIQGFLRHCSNSAGIMELPDANMDMVRAGISIYGIYPSTEMDHDSFRLCPAMELKSHIAYIKTVAEGTPISYGGTYVTPREMKVATIPVGYGDGYPRSLSNKGYVLIRGQRAPILGRVCMDQFMVDVTNIEAELLDEVTLLGRDGDAEITLEELDTLSGRFPYEFVCDIGKRVPRKYI